MPRATRKRRLLNPHRSQLLFVEQPRSGSRHEYGPQLRSAINPRSFVSEQSRQGVQHPWVSPQFTSLEDTAVRCGGQRRKKNNYQLPASTLNRTLLSTQFRSTTCKYPTLLFASNNSVPQRSRRGLGQNSTLSRVGDSPETRHRQCRSHRTVASVSHDDAPRTTSPNTLVCNVSAGAQVTPKPINFAATSCSTPRTSTAEISNVPTPPHIQTPEMPHCDYTASSSIHRLLFSPNQPRTPPRTEKLLVRDTPESDYGLRVTWRRRKKLKRLLTERGQLQDTETMISNHV